MDEARCAKGASVILCVVLAFEGSNVMLHLIHSPPPSLPNLFQLHTNSRNLFKIVVHVTCKSEFIFFFYIRKLMEPIVSLQNISFFQFFYLFQKTFGGILWNDLLFQLPFILLLNVFCTKIILFNRMQNWNSQ